MSHFSSVEQSKVLRFVGSLGTASTGAWASASLSRSRALDSLFAQRYLAVSPLSSAGYIASEDGIFENPYALPIAFSADSGALDSPPDDECPFENLNLIYRKIFPDVGMDVFTRILPVSEPETVGLRQAADGGNVPAGQGESCIRYELPVSSDDPIYLYLIDGHQRGDIVYVNGEYFSSRSTPTTWAPLCLGCFEPGSILTVELRPVEDLSLSMATDAVFYVENSGALSAYAQAANSLPCTTRGGTVSRMSTQATVGEGCFLLYTIPYDDGWQAWVDGKPAEIHKAFGILLAVDAGSGVHSVELRYTTPGLYPGALISLFTALALCAAVIISRRKKAKQKSP